MAALTYTRIALTGTPVTLTAADVAGDTLRPNQSGYLHVKNASASAVTVTVVTPGKTRFGVDEPDVTISVPAGAERVIGPFPDALVNTTDKAIRVNYSAVASVTRGAFYL